MPTIPEAIPRPSDDEQRSETPDPVVDRSTDEQRSETPDPVVDRSTDEPPETLELLADPYARELLIELSHGPCCGRSLAEACSFSRPTVYRRLNRLEDAGLVEAETRLAADGNHCKEFTLVRDSLAVTIEDGAITVTARSTTTE